MSAGRRLDRVQRFVRSARRLVEPDDPLARRAVAILPAATGLSQAGVRHALANCLELEPSAAELEQLCASVAQTEKAHVSLSANVFTAGLRAIALGLAAADQVEVRPSRREPAFAHLLHEASGGAFRLVAEILARPGEHVFAYGSDETLEALEGALPPGVVFHGHGTGVGIVVVDAAALEAEPDLAERLAFDTVAFDQRGCLSPRLVLVDADPNPTRAFARNVSRALAHLEDTVPRGAVLEGEQVDIVRYRATMTYLCEVFESKTSLVVFDGRARQLPIPPTGRNLLVVSTRAPLDFIEPIAPVIAAVGLACRVALAERVQGSIPRARTSPVGRMQRPALDGPVDRRSEPRIL